MTKYFRLYKLLLKKQGTLSMGFWYPGMHGVYDLNSLVIPKFSPSPILYSCDLCQRNFTNLEKLRRHRFEKHPTRQPTLLIYGRPVSGRTLKIQSTLSPNDILIEEASHCLIDGKSISVKELRLFLANATWSFHNIQLSNNGAKSEISLDFQVSDDSDLIEVERALLRLANGQKLNLEAIGGFISDCRSLNTGMSYCDGIAHYLYGVMAKEHAPTSGIDSSNYIYRYSQSVDQLTDINRPIARTIRSLVSFHFNHFFESEALSQQGTLQKVSQAFSSILDGVSWNFDDNFVNTPVDAMCGLLTDQITLEILRDASQDIESLKSKADLLQSRLDKMSAGYDRTKRLLLTIEALSHQENNSSQNVAKKLIRELKPQSFARNWCEVITNRLKAS